MEITIDVFSYRFLLLMTVETFSRASSFRLRFLMQTNIDKMKKKIIKNEFGSGFRFLRTSQ